ncbi:hypothetical protein O4J56_01110 [Nocardiopsis sp. RSe5-2]|uniref:ABC transporter permease n=1 Tax=Nocardiopsis endophytica TaxID=3018445 RepID=A0ABT4TWZ7_9ACTN|nr:hypothetical protein [Nocardiopsis endophytica]MDA2809222.1 hypothetical protein [Nocardiopsis endophytica]
MILRLAAGDLRERVRRPSYAMTLLASAGLAYLAVPAADGHWTVVDAGGFRGVYDMAYVGAVVALAGALWLALGGFYVVRGSVERDRRTGVGRVLATAPLRGPTYLAGKFLSNAAVLVSMVAVLVGVALVMWWARGEDPAVDPVGLLLPFLVVTLPVMAAVAAAALAFDTVPGLRGGFGNLVWIPVWGTFVFLGNSGGGAFSGIGTRAFASTFGVGAERTGVEVGEFSLGFTYVDDPLKPVPWGGLDLGDGFLADRLALVAGAVAVVALCAVWFRLARTDATGSGAAGAVGGRLLGRRLGALDPAALLPAPRTLVGAEFRILVSGVSVWWWLGAGVLLLVGLVLPADAGRTALLPVAWIWPALVWSRIGTTAIASGVEGLVESYPRPVARLLAGWAAGVALSALAGAGPLLRAAAAGDAATVAAWCAGAVFIPALALFLGTLGRTPTLFQVLYPILWYMAVNAIDAADYMGMHTPDPASSAATAGAAAALLLGAVTADRLRRARA